MKTRGGNTDELYAGDPKSKSGGRYKMAASLVGHISTLRASTGASIVGSTSQIIGRQRN